MPIRFRCAYCSQLMGIARRKAGTVVNCPKCQGQVVVPHPGGEAAAATNVSGEDDFEKFLEGADGPVQVLGGQVQVLDPSPATAPRPTWTGRDLDPELRGVFLTPGLLALLGVLVFLLMGVAFFVGMLVGRG